MALDLDTYRQRAERFVSDLDREYYLHFSGQKPTFDLESIYGRDADLFSEGAVEDLRGKVDASEGDERRRLLCLLRLAVDGLIGQSTRQQSERLAEREGSLTIEVDGEQVPYRSSAVLLASEADAGKRAQIDEARRRALDTELNPLLVETIEQSHAWAGELGWNSYAEMYGELKDLDLVALERQTMAFLNATEDVYDQLVESPIRKQVGYGLASFRRCDMARFFRAPEYDAWFTEQRLIPSFNETFAALGFDPATQPNVTLDLETRPTKSPRAFCAPVRVPDEIYLVMPIGGGREDYATLLHEGGHTEHFANADRSLPFEFRHLGDYSVTESFAFLFESLSEDPAWLEALLGVSETGDYKDFTRAARLMFLRRYAAKLSYELELHSGSGDLRQMPDRYARLLGDAVKVDWPASTYLADVDEGFYVANYLRAWALETYWRKKLTEQFGKQWFRSPEAGGYLKRLWSQGQRLDGDDLLDEVLGQRLEFSVLEAEFRSV